MMLATILISALNSNVASGAPLTLIFPLACVLVVLAVWFVVLRRRGG